MKYKGLIMAAVLVLSVASGCLVGHNMGTSFAKEWSAQTDSITADIKYQSVIDENIALLEKKEEVLAYNDVAGFKNDATLIKKQEEWNLVLVNKWNPMEADYVPELTQVAEGHKVDSRIADSLKDMIQGAKQAGYAIYILSSYRDMDKQISLYDAEVEKWVWQGYSEEAAKEKAGTIVAVPGTSEHHLGLAVDLVSSEHVKLDQDAEKTKGYQWLVKHCHEYGFILRYPNNASDITGIIYEPWHFRYVGVEAATEIMEKGITLEEYLGDLAAENCA